MAILRKPKINEFSQISNGVTQNRRLSWKARGILCYLLSKPEGWTVIFNDLLKASEKDGKDSLKAGMKELEAEGFLVWTQARGAGGKFESVLDIYEEALPADLRGTNTRGALKFVTEGGISAQNAGNLAENPPVAENPQPPISEKTDETPENIEENAFFEENTKADNPPEAENPQRLENEPLRENRNGKPATDLIRNVSNTELNNTEELSNDNSKLSVEPPKENFLSGLDKKQIGELQKAICRLTYQKRGAVKPMTETEWQNVAEIFGFWVSFWDLTKATRLTPERGRAVLDRLRATVVWTAEDIKTGILGNAKSPHHSGANERGATYHDLELICRTDQHLAVAIGYAEATEEINNYGNSKIQTEGNAGRNAGGRSNKQSINADNGNDSSDDDERALSRIGARPKS